MTDKSSGVKSLVKTVIIGHVPDRGGRANEMRPRAEKFGSGFSGGFKKGGSGPRGGNNHDHKGNGGSGGGGQTKKSKAESS